MVSPFDLSQALLVDGLLVPCSLPGPPVKTTHANGYSGAWPGWAVSISVLPLTKVLNFEFLSSVSNISYVSNVKQIQN